MNDKLRSLALDNGADMSQWKADDQRAAVHELYQQDEQQKYPSWISDALIELAENKRAREAMIAALEDDDHQLRLLILGNILQAALVKYPIDSLSIVCEESIGEWRAEERQCRAEAEYDSRREASRE